MRSSRSAQFWLVALLLLSGAIAGGALFAKYKLEGLRGRLLESAQTRTGTDIQFESLSAFGLRGLRAEGVKLSRRLSNGSEIDLKLPVTYVYVDLTELLYGQVVVDRIQVEGAELLVRRHAVESPTTPNVPPLDSLNTSLPPFSFRILGSNCKLTVEDINSHRSVSLTDVSFDLAKLTDSPALSGTFDALYGGEPNKRVKATARYVSLADFEARADIQHMTADDVNAYLPASRRFILQGSAQPTLHIAGKQDGTIALSLETSVENLLARDQPEFLEPITGKVVAQASYNPNLRILNVGMANATTESMQGAVTGSIDFSAPSPAFDLKLTSAQLPLDNIISFALRDRPEQYGALNYAVNPDANVAVNLTGTAENPVFDVRASTSGADASFAPKDKRFPSGSVRLGRLDIAWNSKDKTSTGTVNILDGTLTKSDFGLEAARITGTILLEGKRVNVASLTAVMNDETLAANGWYDVEAKKGEMSASGIVSDIENIKLSQSIRNTALAGSTGVRATGKLENGKIAFEGDVDASQTEIGYRWYFLKPAGIGATARITGQFTPKKSVTMDISGVVAGTKLVADLKLQHSGKKWQLRTLNATSDSLDVVSVGKCLPLPYVITGGTAHAGKYTWTRIDNKSGVEWTANFALSVDEIAARAEGAEKAIVCKDLSMTGEMVEGAKATTTINLHAKQAETPPLRGDKWFAPLVRDLKKYPPADRTYVYNLQADSLSVPPWKGTDFKGNAFQSENENGIEKYVAKIDGGTIEGTYRSNRADNSYTTSAKWTNVPSSYFMEHLRQPLIFTGNLNGEVSYEQDRDDPRSLTGKGRFDTSNGQFSADYLIALFERQLEGDVSALPPSLKFSRLESDIEFEGDIVRTPKITLESDAMRMNASGEFVLDGDMNYNIKVAVSPDAAERIPLMRDNFNVQGHRLAQQDIELAFNVTGPTFKPVSTVSETPPVRVTLVSGALETAREALQVIDAPRKILFDLLKIGGGIVGAKKPPQTQN